MQLLALSKADDIDRLRRLEKAKKLGSSRWPLRLLADPADTFFPPTTSLVVSAKSGSIDRMDATLTAQLPFR